MTPAPPAGSGTSAIVLAGGTSRRFGSDKLAAPWAGQTLLDHVVCSLPSVWAVIVVGPERALDRAVRFVREDPPGSGPAAGLVAGVRAAATPTVVTLPGDSPYAAQVVKLLLAELNSGAADAVAAGDNPLFLALRGSAVARLTDPARTDTGRSARSLVAELGARPVSIPTGLLHDVDTPADL